MSPLYHQHKHNDSPTREEYEAILDGVETEIEAAEDCGCSPNMHLLWHRQALQEKLNGFDRFQSMKEMLVQKVASLPE